MVDLNEGSLVLPSLDVMFNPRSIALIGVSSDRKKLGSQPLLFLQKHGYQGKIYPINPRYTEVFDCACYKSLNDCPDEVDMAIVMMPASQDLLDCIRDCGNKGVRSVIVFASGFSEVGPEGKAMEEKLKAIAARTQMLLCGPNCAGLMNFPKAVMASFNQGLEREPITLGPLAFVTQSGALGVHTWITAQDSGIGFDYWVSTGNESVVSFGDYVAYFVDQEDVKAVFGYMEDAKGPEKLKTSALKALTKGVPVIMLKVGTSEKGAKAAASHTGAMAGADEVYDAFFTQYGVIRVKNTEELLDMARVCSAKWAPQRKRTAILSVSGGAGIVMADACDEYGLELLEFSPDTKKKLRELLPAFVPVSNPVDMTTQFLSHPDLINGYMDVILSDPRVDNLMLFFGALKRVGQELAGYIVDVAARYDKAVIVNWMAPPPDAVKILREKGIPVFEEPTRGVKAAARLINYYENRPARLARMNESAASADKPNIPDQALARVNALIAAVEKDKRSAMTEVEAKALLSLFGITCAAGRLAASAEDAVSAAEEVGFPVVMKIVSPAILHKTEVGGVKLRLKDAGAVRAAYGELIAGVKKALPNAPIAGVLVEKSVMGGVETLVGIRKDPRFGFAVAFGSGGILTELFKDFSLRILPVSQQEALAMIEQTKAYRLLNGFRGARKADVRALAETIAALSKAATCLGDKVSEIEINPLFVCEEGQGVIVGDALITIK